MIWKLCTHRAHLLSLCWEAQLSNGSASARVPGLGTSTCRHDPDPEYISVLHSVLFSPPGIWGPERHQHGLPLWRRRTDAAVTADRLSAGTLKGTLPPKTHLSAGDRRPYNPGGRGSWQGQGRQRALWMSVDEREKGSPGSPSEMSLSLPGPTGNLSLRGHAPSPRGSNQK